MSRLYTVVIRHYSDENLSSGGFRDTYEADFAGLQFSRTSEADLKHWIRVAARHVYGNDTHVIFLREVERHES